MMTPTKMKLRVRKKESGARSSRRLLAETSPDSKCPICLDRFNNVASLDRCLHRFCFRCIHEWSKNKAECPLCKQPFRSIFHSVKAENDFKEFVLAPVENGPAVLPAGQTDGGVPSGRVRRPRASRGGERRSRRHQNSAPTTASPDLTLEGLAAGRQETVDQERGVHRMMLRLTERRRSRVEERSLRRLRDQDVVAFRRALYRTGVRVRSGGWDASRQRDVSAAHLRRNPASLRRLLPWLQRELTVLYGSHGSLVSIVQHIIMSRITHYDMDDAAIRDELRPFLLARTDHFLHEMVSFARSTLTIEAYDQQAVYEPPAPSYEEDSGSDSSIIAISEDEDSEEVNITEDVTQERVPPVPVTTGGESSLSQSAWDDETPGPSYSTQSQAEEEPTVDVVQADEVGSSSGAAGPKDDEEECMIVGYVKPMAERTPELVQLSSDSSEEEQEAAAAETVAATVPKVEASSSQTQGPPSPESYLRPLSPSSCPYPSASHSPGSHMDRVSPQPTHLLCSHSEERDTGTLSSHRRKGHTRRPGGRDRSRSGSDSSVLSGDSEPSRTHRHSGSGSRCPEQANCQESRRWSHQSSGHSPTVSVDSSDSSESPSWQWPHSRDRSHPQKSDEELELTRSASARERSSHSSIYWDSPAHHGSERKKARKRRREKERERSRSPLRCRDSRRHHQTQELGLHTTSRPSSSSSSSSSVDSRQGRPCSEKPAGKRKYKTRHLERAAQRQSSRKSNRDRERREAHSSPAKRQRGTERKRSRSPSVEIIFERRAPDTASHRQRRKRHKKKSRREVREQNSPTIITIESGSDTNGCQTSGTAVISRTADCQPHVIEATNSKILHPVIKATPSLIDDQHHLNDANSRTMDEHRHGTKVVHKAMEERHPGTKVIHRTTEDQHHSTKVVHSTTEEEHHGTKVVHRTTEDQHHGTKVVHRTAEDQHHGTKVVHRTAEDQHHGTKVVHRTAEDQHSITNSTTDIDPLVSKVTNSTADHEIHATEVTDYNQSALVDDGDNGQDVAVKMLEQSVERSDPVPEATLSEVDRSLSVSASVPGPSAESYSPVTPSEHLLDSPDCALNLEQCVVDVVDHDSLDCSKNLRRAGDLCQDVAVTAVTPPSDTRLLESILQELEDILPEEGQGAESGHKAASTDSAVDHLQGTIGPHRDSERETSGTRGADPSPAV